jgi:hypothetical protein
LTRPPDPQRAADTPVLEGMLLASFIGIFAIPPLYTFFQKYPGEAETGRSPEGENSGRWCRGRKPRVA